jgi:tetratricopeptide (TPR) repeat protein
MDVNADDYDSDRANAHCRLGSIYLADRKFDEAISAFRRGSDLAPYYWAAYYGLGEAYEHKDQLDLALANFETAKRFNPGNVDIYVRTGHLLFNKRRYKESVAQYLEALELKPDWAEPHRWLANNYEFMGDKERAQFHRMKFREKNLLNSEDEHFGKDSP